jgi:hypothetical protein
MKPKRRPVVSDFEEGMGKIMQEVQPIDCSYHTKFQHDEEFAS